MDCLTTHDIVRMLKTWFEIEIFLPIAINQPDRGDSIAVGNQYGSTDRLDEQTISVS